jgi:hypothetical protein
MGEVLPLPNRGEVFLDPRGEGRSLRVSWHPDENTLVLSLWQLGQCRATFRLQTEEVPDLVRALVAGLSDGLVQQRAAAQQAAAAATAGRPSPPRWDRPPVIQASAVEAHTVPAEAPTKAEPEAESKPEPATQAAATVPIEPAAKPASADDKPEPPEADGEQSQVTPVFLAPPDPA